MPPKGFRKQDPAERQKLLTAARAIVSVLRAGDPDDVYLLMAGVNLENAERSPTPAPIAPLLEGPQA